jgi:hypothetical protein
MAAGFCEKHKKSYQYFCQDCVNNKPALPSYHPRPRPQAHRWEEIRNLEHPFPGNPGPDKFGYWFNYFWFEAIERPDLTEEQKSKLSGAFFDVFESAQGTFKPIADLESKDDYFLENVLRQILLIGFKRVALEPPRMASYKTAGGLPLFPPPLNAVDAANLNWLHAVSSSAGGELKIGFRSDARSYEELALSDGFQARARQDNELDKRIVFNQKWHPYHNYIYRNSLFLRLGAVNKDACIHTVVSTGPRLEMLTHFPILNDLGNFGAISQSGHYLACKPAGLWTDADIALALRHRYKVRAVKPAPPTEGIDHLEIGNHMHVFFATGLQGFNTQAYFSGHDSFPERSMKQIPLSNLLADIPYIQKWWYSREEGKIVFYDLEFSDIRWKPSEDAVGKILGEEGKGKLKEIIHLGTEAARNDPVFLDYRRAYNTYQQQKNDPRWVKDSEMEFVILAVQKHVRDYKNDHNGRYANDRAAEKNAVNSANTSRVPPISADKINLLADDPQQWAAIRERALAHP